MWIFADVEVKYAKQSSHKNKNLFSYKTSKAHARINYETIQLTTLYLIIL